MLQRPQLNANAMAHHGGKIYFWQSGQWAATWRHRYEPGFISQEKLL